MKDDIQLHYQPKNRIIKFDYASDFIRLNVLNINLKIAI